MSTTHIKQVNSHSVSREQRIAMATTMSRRMQSSTGHGAGWRIIDIGEAMEIPSSTVYHRLSGRLQRTEAHQCQQKLTPGEELHGLRK